METENNIVFMVQGLDGNISQVNADEYLLEDSRLMFRNKNGDFIAEYNYVHVYNIITKTLKNASQA